MDGTFTCAVCCFEKPLDLLWPEGACQCLICRGCMELFAAKVWHKRIADLQITEVSAGRQYSQRESVWYVFPDGRCEAATVISIDPTVTPTSYGVAFNATPERTRETVAARLKPVIAADRSNLDTEGYPCPAASCQAIVAASILQGLAKEAFDDFCMAANEASLHAMGITGCPNCGAYVERLPPANSLNALPQAVENNQEVNQTAALHRATHRYRCAACKQDFCGQCFATPYHAELTCEEHKAPKCLYCQAPLLEEDSYMDTDSASSRELTAGIKAQGVDSRWCLEKADLVQLYDRLQQVCQGPECKSKLSQGCSRLLACGHWCGGVAGETDCLPCLHGCSNTHMHSGVTLTSRAVTLNGQDACPMCWEPLACGPAIILTCDHACHLACAKEHLKQGYPGPAISFNFLSCPSCGEGGGHRHGNLQISSSAPPMQHPALIESLKRPLELRKQTVQRAKQCLKMEGLHFDPALKPGGSFDGRPADFALTKLLFYECHKCSRPYYGGQRQCGVDGQVNEGGPAANGSNSQELLCGGCSAHQAGSKCARHGSEFTEWKCRYCCTIASFFCFGTTHMCNACHQKWQLRPGCLTVSRRSCTPISCPLRTAHPDHGHEHCLGCALCRTND